MKVVYSLFFTSTHFSPFLGWLYGTEAEIGSAFMTLQNIPLLHVTFNKKEAPLLFSKWRPSHSLVQSLLKASANDHTHTAEI